MQSNNPVFRRSEEFQRSPYGNQSTYPGYEPQGYGEPAGFGQAPVQTAPGRMTVDTVVQKTALTVGLVILTAAATWVLTPSIDGATTS